MYIQTFLIQGAALISACLVLMVTVLSYLYFRANKALFSLEEKFTQYKESNESEANRILQEAKEKALHIVQESTLFDQEIKNNLEKAIYESIQKGTTTYTNLLTDIKNKTVTDLANIEKVLEAKANSGVAQISETINKTTEETERMFAKTIDEQKEKELSLLKQKVLAMLPEVLEETTLNSLSRENQEQIALDAINKIKINHGL